MPPPKSTFPPYLSAARILFSDTPRPPTAPEPAGALTLAGAPRSAKAPRLGRRLSLGGMSTTATRWTSRRERFAANGPDTVRGASPTDPRRLITSARSERPRSGDAARPDVPGAERDRRASPGKTVSGSKNSRNRATCRFRNARQWRTIREISGGPPHWSTHAQPRARISSALIRKARRSGRSGGCCGRAAPALAIVDQAARAGAAVLPAFSSPAATAWHAVAAPTARTASPTRPATTCRQASPICRPLATCARAVIPAPANDQAATCRPMAPPMSPRNRTPSEPPRGAEAARSLRGPRTERRPLPDSLRGGADVARTPRATSAPSRNGPAVPEYRNASTGLDLAGVRMGDRSGAGNGSHGSTGARRLCGWSMVLARLRLVSGGCCSRPRKRDGRDLGKMRKRRRSGNVLASPSDADAAPAGRSPTVGNPWRRQLTPMTSPAQHRDTDPPWAEAHSTLLTADPSRRRPPNYDGLVPATRLSPLLATGAPRRHFHD